MIKYKTKSFAMAICKHEIHTMTLFENINNNKTENVFFFGFDKYFD